MRRVFSFTSCSSVCVRALVVVFSSNWSYCCASAILYQTEYRIESRPPLAVRGVCIRQETARYQLIAPRARSLLAATHDLLLIERESENGPSVSMSVCDIET